ncbi:MAG: VanZ family protein [Clostridia bacterium]
MLFSVCMDLYALLAMVVPCLVYLLIMGKSRHFADGTHYILVAVFLLYLFCLFRVTGIGTVWDIGHYDRIFHWDNMSLVPFQSQGMRTYVLNVLLFLPLGFLLPLLSQGYHGLSRTVAAGFLCSLAIECGQLLNLRCSDVDDLLMNTLGALCGYGLWFMVSRLCHREYFPSAVISPKEPKVYMLLSFGGTFFLYNPWLFWS